MKNTGCCVAHAHFNKKFESYAFHKKLNAILMMVIMMVGFGRLSASQAQVLPMVGGHHHTCAMLEGALKCWGTNTNGELGNGNNDDSFVPVSVIDSDFSAPVIQLEAGNNHTCALLEDGGVKCWGGNSDGQLGDGTLGTSRNRPITVNLPNAIDIAVGTTHTCAVLEDHSVRCWGANSQGQLGNGGTGSQANPVVVSGIANAVGVAAGAQHTCALLDDTSVKCWGFNYYGQLGLGYSNLNQLTPNQPVRESSTISTPLFNVTQIVLGSDHTCALLSSGQAKCWGYNIQGQVGNDQVGQLQQNSPDFVIDAYSPYTGDPLNPRGPLTNIVQLITGGYFSSALLDDGSIRVWGSNSKGELADSSLSQWSNAIRVLDDGQPIATATQIEVGTFHACYRNSSGDTSCWGDNANGQIGNGQESSTPVYDPMIVIVPAPTFTSPTTIAAGGDHSCAIKNNTVYCWGYNYQGQLGDGSSPGVYPTPVSVNVVDPVQVATGDRHSCALTVGGSVQCWGYNAMGQLGDGTQSNSNVPVSVNGINNAIQITAGNNHSCALLEDGTAQCWGYIAQYYLTPEVITDLNDAIQISAGASHTCALLDEGTAKCWGGNGYQVYGTPGFFWPYTKAIAVQNGDLANLQQIVGGSSFTCALLKDGTAKCWGRNDKGQLGVGDTLDKGTPTSVLESPSLELNAVKQLAAGKSHACALLNNGTAKCWGQNSVSQLGDPNVFGHSDVAASAISLFTAPETGTSVSSGETHTCAMSDAFQVLCWGNNYYGQFGNGNSFYNTSTPAQALLP